MVLMERLRQAVRLSPYVLHWVHLARNLSPTSSSNTNASNPARTTGVSAGDGLDAWSTDVLSAVVVSFTALE
jgi:hypothetical protein